MEDTGTPAASQRRMRPKRPEYYVQILDTWRVMDMPGTRSHDIELADVFIGDAGKVALGRDVDSD